MTTDKSASTHGAPPDENYVAARCCQCKKHTVDKSTMLMCGGCKTLHYCSKTCHQMNWKIGHSKECRNLNACRLSGAQFETLIPVFLDTRRRAEMFLITLASIRDQLVRPTRIRISFSHDSKLNGTVELAAIIKWCRTIPDEGSFRDEQQDSTTYPALSRIPSAYSSIPRPFPQVSIVRRLNSVASWQEHVQLLYAESSWSTSASDSGGSGNASSKDDGESGDGDADFKNDVVKSTPPPSVLVNIVSDIDIWHPRRIVYYRASIGAWLQSHHETATSSRSSIKREDAQAYMSKWTFILEAPGVAMLAPDTDVTFDMDLIDSRFVSTSLLKGFTTIRGTRDPSDTGDLTNLDTTPVPFHLAAFIFSSATVCSIMDPLPKSVVLPPAGQSLAYALVGHALATGATNSFAMHITVGCHFSWFIYRRPRTGVRIPLDYGEHATANADDIDDESDYLGHDQATKFTAPCMCCTLESDAAYVNPAVSSHAGARAFTLSRLEMNTQWSFYARAPLAIAADSVYAATRAEVNTALSNASDRAEFNQRASVPTISLSRSATKAFVTRRYACLARTWKGTGISWTPTCSAASDGASSASATLSKSSVPSKPLPAKVVAPSSAPPPMSTADLESLFSQLGIKKPIDPAIDVVGV